MKSVCRSRDHIAPYDKETSKSQAQSNHRVVREQHPSQHRDTISPSPVAETNLSAMKAVSKFAAAGRRLRAGGGSGGSGGGLNGLSPQHVAAGNRLSPLPPHGISAAQEQQLSLTGIFSPSLAGLFSSGILVVSMLC